MAQVWAVAADGGYMYSDELSEILRLALQPMLRFREHCDAKDATDKGLHAGDTYTWNVYSNVATQGTDLDEQTEMPETKFTITQGSLTVGELGNSVPYSGKLDNLSKHPVKEVITKVLKNDANKALDTKAYTQFAATPLKVYSTSATAVTLNTASTFGTATHAMAKAHVKLIVDTMKERNIPMFSGSDYYCVTWPSTIRTFKDELETLNSYVGEGYRKIQNGEIGRYEGTRFIEQTNIAKAGYTNTDWAFFFGEDTVAEALVVPEEIRGKIPGDFGRSRGVAWYYLGGFGLVHTDAANARILHWGSDS
jgi:N4-gp56 family major capsid protein